HCVHVYDKATRKLLFEIPHSNQSTNLEALLFQPTNIALDKDENLFVSDTGASRVRVYDYEGHYVRGFGENGDSPQWGQLKLPKGVAVDREGRAYVVDTAFQLVQIFDKAGKYL